MRTTSGSFAVASAISAPCSWELSPKKQRGGSHVMSLVRQLVRDFPCATLPPSLARSSLTFPLSQPPASHLPPTSVRSPPSAPPSR
ncbi:hypothetical protein VUR80DRAFT_6258 [Thermomyces stellatus]